TRRGRFFWTACARPGPFLAHDARGETPQHNMTSSKTPMIASGRPPTRNPGRSVRLSVLALALATVAPLTAAPPELATQGNQIVVKATGEPVRLTGVNIASLEWRIDGQNLLTSLQVAVQEWKSNVIRLPVDRTSWLGASSTSDPYKAVV